MPTPIWLRPASKGDLQRAIRSTLELMVERAREEWRDYRRRKRLGIFSAADESRAAARAHIGDARTLRFMAGCPRSVASERRLARNRRIHAPKTTEAST